MAKEVTPEAKEKDSDKPLFRRMRDWAREAHSTLDWGEFVQPSGDQDESLIALFIFLEENGVDVDASGLIEQGHPGEGWQPTAVDLEQKAVETALFRSRHRVFLEKLAQILPEFARNLQRAPIQIEGESLSEEARLYRSSRARLAYEYQERAEAALPEDLKKLAAKNQKRKKAVEAIAFRLAEMALAEKGITKPSELA